MFANSILEAIIGDDILKDQTSNAANSTHFSFPIFSQSTRSSLVESLERFY